MYKLQQGFSRAKKLERGGAYHHVNAKCFICCQAETFDSGTQTTIPCILPVRTEMGPSTIQN